MERSGRGLYTIPAFSWGTEESLEIPDRIASFRAETRTREVQNTKEECQPLERHVLSKSHLHTNQNLNTKLENV
jgi:hypothetical protein